MSIEAIVTCDHCGKKRSIEFTNSGWMKVTIGYAHAVDKDYCTECRVKMFHGLMKDKPIQE